MFGILIFNGDRLDIALEDGTLYGGLHCGDCFRYYADGWLHVRLEYNEDEWVLVCHENPIPIKYGTQVNL